MPTLARLPSVFGEISTTDSLFFAGAGLFIVADLPCVIVTLIFCPGFKLLIATEALLSPTFGAISSGLATVDDADGFGDGFGDGFADALGELTGVGFTVGFTVGLLDGAGARVTGAGVTGAGFDGETLGDGEELGVGFGVGVGFTAGGFAG